MVMVRRELKILDGTGLLEKKLEKQNCDKNEQNCDEKEVGRIFKKNLFVRPRNEFAVKNRFIFALFKVTLTFNRT